MAGLLFAPLFGHAAIAAEADAQLVEYGEYLAGECVTCHQISGRDNGIPAIVGWDRNIFFATLKLYKTGSRKHQVMNMIAQPLGDEEMKALAAYFATIKPAPKKDGEDDEDGPRSRFGGG
jgi:cytochrome c